jgi:uncharacterized protein YggT (Ycf19 family)
MKSLILTVLVALAAICPAVQASIFLPGGSSSSARSFVDLGVRPCDSSFHRRRCQQRALSKQRTFNVQNARRHLAMAIPGNGVAEQVIIGGFGNFVSIYNTVITARILLSWFPQAQGMAVLQPVYQITDPYLNLFRGIIPPIFGLDLSPILAFVTLDLLKTSTISLAAEIPAGLKEKMDKSKSSFGMAVRRGRHQMFM